MQIGDKKNCYIEYLEIGWLFEIAHTNLMSLDTHFDTLNGTQTGFKTEGRLHSVYIYVHGNFSRFIHFVVSGKNII